MLCPRCGHENLEGELFCDACRGRLPRPSAEIYSAMYRAQDDLWQARRRRDAVLALIRGLTTGLGTLALGMLIETWGGDLNLVAFGRHTFWLVGLLWGLGVWGLRRVSSSER